MPDGNHHAAAVVTVMVNGRAISLPRGATVAAAFLNAGVPCRISESGRPRAPFCGIGVCLECCAVVDGVPHRCTCLVLCCEGMIVETQR
jgi:D-hydroxyproline dehydrogenase subunit gamma